MDRMLRAFIVISMLGVANVSAAEDSDIRKVDFYNFVYAWNQDDQVPETWQWISKTPSIQAKTTQGGYHFSESGEETLHSPMIRVESVTYGSLIADGQDQAVVSLNYSTGGTANWDYLYVYRLAHGQPFLVARMRTGSRGSGGLVGLSIDRGLLTVCFADKERMEGDCCSRGFVRVQYRWDGRKFVEVGARERGDLGVSDHLFRPAFGDYAVSEIYHGPAARPVITADFWSFRTRIRQGADSEVEFAGHYTLPRWGCGTDCNAFVVVDSKTGKIYEGSVLDELPSNWKEQWGAEDIERMEFQPKSRLLKVNACISENNCGLYDYLMIDGKGLKLIRMQLLPGSFQPPRIP